MLSWVVIDRLHLRLFTLSEVKGPEPVGSLSGPASSPLPSVSVHSVVKSFCSLFFPSVLVTRHSPLVTVHLSPFFSASCGLFCTMDARNAFPFNRFRTLSIAMGVYTPYLSNRGT
jgi:hypothetical protein